MSRNRERGDQVEARMPVRPPPFMETAVSGWFAIINAQFHLANISDSVTKFYHVLSSLPADVVARVDPTVIAGQDFARLKEAVIEMFEKTKPELFEKLISKSVMTGRPSEFLGDLRDVASKVGVGDDLVRHKFIQSLPPAMSTVLATGGSRGGGAIWPWPPPKPRKGGPDGHLAPPKTHDFLEKNLKLFFSKVNFGQSQKIVD